jgi:hypothetical protein
MVRSEIQRYLMTHAFNGSTIYEVFLPPASHATNGADTSCGGPNPTFCEYHSFFTSGSSTIKYTVQPYASCSGCQIAGWTAAQSQEHLVAKSTRAAVVDPLFTSWYDSAIGVEMGDKCLWSPAPFLAGVYGYPYEWSNLAKACVQTR